MNRKIKCLLSFTLFLSLCFTLAITASARASLYFSRYSANIYIESKNSLSVCFDALGTSEMDQIGAKTIVLQEQTATSNWTTIKTYYVSDYPSMMGNKTTYYSGDVPYANCIPNASYRAVVTLWAGKDGGGDTRTCITEVEVAK